MYPTFLKKPAQSALARANPAHGPTAVSQLLYPKTTAIKCHFPQENDTQHDARKGTLIVEPL
jgi:hypothetical protein